VYFPSKLLTPDATTGPGTRVMLVFPSRRVILIVPVTPSGTQIMSNGTPAGRTWSRVGEVMLSKNWAKAEGARAKKAVEKNEKRMIKNRLGKM